MAKALFACDELTGFITAVVHVHPSKSVSGVRTESVKKKLKDKRFAANVKREEVYAAAQESGVPLDEHIAFILAVLGQHASELGFQP